MTWDVTDTVTFVLGSHSLKLGVEYRLLFGNNFQTSAPSGSFNFAASLTGNPQNQSGTGNIYADFLLGAVSSASGSTTIGESEKGDTWSGFIQDNWRVSRKVNINLGLRYDYQQPPYERNCGTSNFNPTAIDPVGNLLGAMQYACKEYGKTYLNSEYTDFAPRVGIALDPHGDGKMAIRVGYGMYYAGDFNTTVFGNLAGFGSTTTTYSAPGGNANLPAFYLGQGFPTPLTQPLGSALGPGYLLGQGVNYDQPGQRVPMSQQWNFSIQNKFWEAGWSMLPIPAIAAPTWLREVTDWTNCPINTSSSERRCKTRCRTLTPVSCQDRSGRRPLPNSSRCFPIRTTRASACEILIWGIPSITQMLTVQSDLARASPSSPRTPNPN